MKQKYKAFINSLVHKILRVSKLIPTCTKLPNSWPITKKKLRFYRKHYFDRIQSQLEQGKKLVRVVTKWVSQE